MMRVLCIGLILNIRREDAFILDQTGYLEWILHLIFNNQDMIFSFSGDDDVWVFLTDLDHPEKGSQLVLDIGGNHGVMDGSINFASGEVKYSNENARTKERYYGLKDNPSIVYPVIYN